MKTIKLSTFDVCMYVFEASKWRTKTTKKDIHQLVTYLIGRAITERKKNHIEISNKLIEHAARVCCIYQCTFQGAKKYRKAFGIEEG